MSNDLVEFWATVPGFPFSLQASLEEMYGKPRWHKGQDSLEMFAARDKAIAQYSWAIPTDEALDAIASHGPVVEIGAGQGYWAMLLEQRGVDVLAYDRDPSGKDALAGRDNGNGPWFKVRRGGPTKAKRHSDRTLFLCWPPYSSSMAAECLANYSGSTVAYVGEWDGCTADEAFHSELETNFKEVQAVELPQWDGLHDYLGIWKRNGQG